ncbi:MAG TPA: RluA family pseudouridine synthase [Eubacteriaceae bacterium]|nr:RluA family pseudouridine synthase [Eubacteriaceae bacterium]
MKEWTIQGNDADQRLDRFLSKALQNASKGFIQKSIRKKKVKINGQKTEANYRLQEGDVMRLYLSDEFFETKEKSDTRPYPTKDPGEDLAILHEDEGLLAVNKRRNQLTHGAADGVVERAIDYLIQTRAYQPEKELSFTPASCNRLDQNTTGIVLIAKNHESLKRINEKIKRRETEKIYTALVKGRVDKEIRAEGYIQKNTQENLSVVSREYREGAKSVATLFRPIEHFAGYTLLEVQLITGRSHQIRSQLKELGFPVVGDRKYGDPALNAKVKSILGFTDQFLHSGRFVIKGYYGPEKDLAIEAPLPEEWGKITAQFKKE